MTAPGATGSSATGPRDPSGPRLLRIGVVTNNLAITGGVERCVLEDSRELVRAGHHVEVWHRSHRPPSADGTLDGSGPYDDLGIDLHPTGDRAFGVRSAPRDALRFVRDGLRLRRSHLDVIWLNRPEHLPWGRVVSAVSGVPLVVHLHHAPNYRRLGPIAGGRTHYLAVSHAMARAWAAAGVPTSRVTVVPNGVDTALFPEPSRAEALHARRTIGIAPGTPTVLYYGRLTRSKGVLALLDAWALVLERHAARHPVTSPAGTGPEVRPPLLVLAGAVGPDEAGEVRAAVAALPEDSVLVLPERDDVVPLLHAADMVVVPSIEPEGFGRVVVEAMSTGRPVVAAAGGGTGEILSGEWAGSTVDPTDAHALADKVLATLERVERDPSLGDRCRAWVRDHYGRGPHLSGLVRALLEHSGR